MVFGTCTTWMRPPAFSSSFIAEKAVSSPPMVMSWETFRRSSEMTVFSRCSGSGVGLAREMPMCEPPRKWMRLTSSMVSGRTWSMLPCMIHSKPSRTPSTSTPSSAPRMVAAPITLLMPGAGPPPTRMASFLPVRHAIRPLVLSLRRARCGGLATASDAARPQDIAHRPPHGEHARGVPRRGGVAPAPDPGAGDALGSAVAPPAPPTDHARPRETPMPDLKDLRLDHFSGCVKDTFRLDVRRRRDARSRADRGPGAAVRQACRRTASGAG